MGTEAWIWMGAWALVMLLVVWLLVHEPRHDRREDPGAILRDRFARGEINEEEFRRATNAIEDDQPIASAIGAHHHAPDELTKGQEARHD